ncbi:hypothetical protein M422DRAFT_39362 [Sphaerobolus stellatus SS14]|uniref:Uncharacterized protein n=1 Tax=Sphaerobolus stellatus (strain SS14) TaxID=990650 RepID=A0A0C9T525_SPHS4|nr:hypothetical protein M422DRAFT_39362 [Sphaerobolus stellatus SS14]
MLPLPPSFPVQGRALAVNVSTLSMIIIHFESTLDSQLMRSTQEAQVLYLTYLSHRTANIHSPSRELKFRRYHG